MLVAIEGGDGAGKNTQTQLLKARAEAAGLRVGVLAFPRYDQTHFAQSIREYLNGKFGELETVPPQFSGLLYAGDRFESKQMILDLMERNDLVILDRYVSSNLAYQGARVTGEARGPFIDWLAHVEYEVYGLPQADLTLYLEVPVETAARKIQERNARGEAANAVDIHEKSQSYLAACREVYGMLAERQYRSRWVRCVCTREGELRPAQEIAEEVWQGLIAFREQG